MSAIWFYKPHDVLGRLVHLFTEDPIVHVGIQHNVTDLTVFTQAAPKRGVYCSAVSKVRKADCKVFLEIHDEWTTRWMVNKWGVRYGWLDIAAFVVPSFDKAAKKDDAVTCAELVAEYLRDAVEAGYPVPGYEKLASLPTYKTRPYHIYEALYPKPA